MTVDRLAPHDKETECADGFAPVPVTSIIEFPSVEFVMKVTVPDDGPAPKAVKVSENAFESPTAIVAGYCVPSIPNPEPVTFALLTVNGKVPVLKMIAVDT